MEKFIEAGVVGVESVEERRVRRAERIGRGGEVSVEVGVVGRPISNSIREKFDVKGFKGETELFEVRTFVRIS